MPIKINGIQVYTKAETDQKELAGYAASIANRNAIPVVVAQTDWTQQPATHPQEGWYYADVIHGRTTSSIAYVAAAIGADDLIFINDGTNMINRRQSAGTVRIWLSEEPQYDLLCLVVYA